MPKPETSTQEKSNLPAVSLGTLPKTMAELEQLPAADLARAVIALRRQDVAALGDGEVFVRRTQDGLVRAVRGRVTLSASKKQICNIQGTWTITADGYDATNSIAGLHIVTPREVMVGGKPEANPYIITHPETHQTLDVYIRKIALGRAPTGNMVAIDQTLHFSPMAYLIRDLMVIAQRTPDAAKVVHLDKVSDEDKQGIDKWLIPTSPPVGLLVNISHTEIIKKLKDHQEVILFAERRASTICARNALKKHPAIAVRVIEPHNGMVSLPVIGWMVSDGDLRKAGEMAQRVGEGECPEDLDVRDAGMMEATEDDIPPGAEEEAAPGEIPPDEDGENDPSALTGDSLFDDDEGGGL